MKPQFDELLGFCYEMTLYVILINISLMILKVIVGGI